MASTSTVVTLASPVTRYFLASSPAITLHEHMQQHMILSIWLRARGLQQRSWLRHGPLAGDAWTTYWTLYVACMLQQVYIVSTSASGGLWCYGRFKWAVMGVK